MDNKEIKRAKVTLGIISVLMGGIISVLMGISSVIMSLLGTLSINGFSLQEIFVGKHSQAVIAVLTVCIVGMCMAMVISGSMQKTKRVEEVFNFIHNAIIMLFILWIVIGNPLEKVIFAIDLVTYSSALFFMSLLRNYRLRQYLEIKER